MSGIMAVLAAVGGIAPVTRTYNTSGAGSDTAPAGAVQVVIEGWGSGGGGSRDNGGAGPGTGGACGGYFKKTLATTGGTVYSHTVGAGGNGRSGTDGNGNSAGGPTSIAALSLTANGGGFGLLSGALPAGGTATGGDINTTGSQSPSPGGVAGQAGGVPGGGGAPGLAATSNGGTGGVGQIKYSYT